ncbi:hypothetical protein OAF63_00485 [Saprospiraceae bacterium]|nr:hypothetical protein [Bacteroidota bacterium]MDB4727238.1 hypothetical protein [Saprospiraceae bacterium]
MRFSGFLFFAFLSFSSFAQEETSYGFYTDVNFGLFPAGDDLMYGFNMSAGHRFTKNIGIGLSLNRAGKRTVDTNRAVFGMSLEPRLVYNSLLVKLNAGMVLNVDYFDGYCNGNEVGGTNFYFRPSAEYRLGSFTFGLSGILAPNLVFNMMDNDLENPSGFCDTSPYHMSNYESRFIFFSIGLSFPKYVKE